MARPLLVTTWPFGRDANAAAWPALDAGGASLDAVEVVCRHVELDPSVDTVGRGGLPDRDGQVSLDGCTMQSPRRCGGVCGLRRHAHPVSVARRVMELTPHSLLAGPDADDFADAQGFASEELLTERARSAWWEWRYSGSPVATHDTVCALALDRAGVLSGACSTSGMAYKLPGRVGDSPIVGHGLYVHPAHGAAAATGTGELVMGLCGSFLAVEELRRGARPLDALAAALARIREEYELEPADQVGMIAVTPDGDWAAGALRRGYTVSVRGPSVDELLEPGLVLLEE